MHGKNPFVTALVETIVFLVLFPFRLVIVIFEIIRDGWKKKWFPVAKHASKKVVSKILTDVTISKEDLLALISSDVGQEDPMDFDAPKENEDLQSLSPMQRLKVSVMRDLSLSDLSSAVGTAVGVMVVFCLVFPWIALVYFRSLENSMAMKVTKIGKKVAEIEAMETEVKTAYGILLSDESIMSIARRSGMMNTSQYVRLVSRDLGGAISLVKYEATPSQAKKTHRPVSVRPTGRKKPDKAQNTIRPTQKPDTKKAQTKASGKNTIRTNRSQPNRTPALIGNGKNSGKPIRERIAPDKGKRRSREKGPGQTTGKQNEKAH